MPSFSKKLNCPSTNTLLAFNSGLLSPVIRLSVEKHLASCDFCDAERRFLRHYRPCGVVSEAAPPIPFPLLTLAESFFLLQDEESEPRNDFDAAQEDTCAESL